MEYRPLFPKNRQDFGIGIVGFGSVAQKWHITAYRKYGLKIVGVYDISPETTAEIRKQSNDVQVFENLDQLLDHPDIKVVDIATRPLGRVELIRRALHAGKHVLSQKPLATDFKEAVSIVEEAEKLGMKLAINQNGRWAPPWRYASLLIKDGAIGEVQCVTHLFDTRLSWIPNPLHGSSQFFIYDYSIHWIDIIRCWLEDRTLIRVRAQDFPAPKQLGDGSTIHSMWIAFEYACGTNAVIRGVGCADSHTGHPFWIHGADGTIRGSVDCKSGDYLELIQSGKANRYELEGDWFPDGFAGTMGELLCAITEDREPYNSGKHHLLTLESTLAACRSAELGGESVPITVAE
jgi:predicted dehydrogenase